MIIVRKVIYVLPDGTIARELVPTTICYNHKQVEELRQVLLAWSGCKDVHLELGYGIL